VRVRLFLRAIIVLASAGLFVAGSLSLTKLFDLGLPCGGAHGCDIVNSHPSSSWFGIPVSYIGFGGYLIIAALAIARAGLPAAAGRRLALGGYLFSAFGAVTSAKATFAFAQSPSVTKAVVGHTNLVGTANTFTGTINDNGTTKSVQIPLSTGDLFFRLKR